MCTDQHIRVTVPVHITGRAHTNTGRVTRINPFQYKAVAAIQGTQIHTRCKATCFSKHHIRLTTTGSAGIRSMGTNQKIRVTIPVHITRRTHRMPRSVSHINPLQYKAVTPTQGAQIHTRIKTLTLTEHHVRLTTTGSAGIRCIGTDQNVCIAIPVHVTGCTHRPPGRVTRMDPLQHKTVFAVQLRKQDPRGRSTRYAKGDQDLSSTLSEAMITAFVRALPFPVRSQIYTVSGITGNCQCVGRVTQVQYFQVIHYQRVVATARKIHQLDTRYIRIGNAGQV